MGSKKYGSAAGNRIELRSYEQPQKITQAYGPKIARAAFELGAIRLNVTDPFRWVSGYRMPIYNDNRRLLASGKVRALIAEGLKRF